ncbi:MAG: Holliday junction branch migration protein RuvA [Fidelibacterota bacterium]|nr:MAG: Holliday junction branch migration protein RuvA [Candidatus Neomarinimicrobiota bacterium]
MIVRLTGSLLEKHPDHIVLDVQGVGYQVWITLNTFETLPDVSQQVTLLTYHQVREDSQDLFGFASVEEREVFRQLIAISGIGAKTAITILSGALPDELRRRVREGDEAALIAIPGIGPKMARRILTELRDTFGEVGRPWAGDVSSLAEGERDTVTQAVESLMALGYKPYEAQRAVRSAVKSAGPEAPVEELIRAALSGK